MPDTILQQSKDREQDFTNTSYSKSHAYKDKTVVEVYEYALDMLDNQQIYDLYDHQFQADGTGKLRGIPPFRESSSGTSFTVFCDGRFYDSGEDFCAYPVDYIHSMKIGYWEKAEGKDFVEAVKVLCDKANISFPEYNYSQNELEKIKLFQHKRELLSEVYKHCYDYLFNESEKSNKALDYLKKRGLSIDGINKLQLGFYNHNSVENYLINQGFTKEEIKQAGLSEKFNNHIIIPWKDPRNQPLTLYSRYFEKTPPQGVKKTYALQGKNSKRYPLGFNYAVENRHKDLVFVEGLFDVLLPQSLGESNIVGSISAQFGNEQIKHLKNYRVESITIVNDPDSGGISGTLSNIKNLLEAGIDCYIPEKLPNGYDPDEFIFYKGIEAWRDHLKTADNAFTWLVKYYEDLYNDGTDKGRDKAINELCKKIGNYNLSPNMIAKANPILKDKLGITFDDMKTKSTGKGFGANSLKKGDVISLIDEVINGNYSGSELSVKLKELEQETGWKKHDLEKLYHQRIEEIELEETKEDRKKELEELLKVGTEKIDLSEVFEDNLAKALDNAREHLSGANSEGLISSILPIISSMIPIGNLINLDYGFIVKPIFWVCIIAKSSSKKSTVQDKLCEPLMKVIDQELEEKYQQEIQQWKKDCITAKEQNEPKPPQPEREFVMIDDSTMEKLMQILQYQKGRGLLLRKDEFSGFFDSMNAYKSGKGDDVQKWLQIRNGRELTITRVSKDDNGRNYYSVPSPNISVLGTIQPQTLIKTINKMGGFEDHNGMISRICFSELKLTKIGQRKRGKYYVDISEFLAGFYKKLRALEPKQYACTNEALDYFNEWYNQLEHYSERYAQSDSGLSNVYAKMEGRTGELALVLHLANACLRDELPNEEINLETMEAAVKLSSYYIDQYRKFRLDHEEQQKSDENALPPLLKAIVDVASKKQDWITPSKLKQERRSKFQAKTQPEIVGHFNELVELGYGETKKEGKTVKYRKIQQSDYSDYSDYPNPSNADVEEVLENSRTTNKATTKSTTKENPTTNTTINSDTTTQDDQSTNSANGRKIVTQDQGDYQSDYLTKNSHSEGFSNNDSRNSRNSRTTTEENNYINQDFIMDHEFSFEASNDLISKIHDGTLKKNLNVWTYGNHRYDVILTDDGIITSIQKAFELDI